MKLLEEIVFDQDEYVELFMILAPKKMLLIWSGVRLELMVAFSLFSGQRTCFIFGASSESSLGWVRIILKEISQVPSRIGTGTILVDSF